MKPKKERKGSKICYECIKRIDLDVDKYVLLGTYNCQKNPDKPDEAYFHFPCWVDYYNNKVREKARNTVKMMQDQSVALLNSPIMKGILNNIQGSEQMMTMLQTPLEKTIPKQRVLIKLQNDRAKRERKPKREKSTKKMQ